MVVEGSNFNSPYLTLSKIKFLESLKEKKIKFQPMLNCYFFSRPNLHHIPWTQHKEKAEEAEDGMRTRLVVEGVLRGEERVKKEI